MRITLFDCLDSFTWNLVHDLERAGARVRVVEEGQWQPSDWAQTDALVLSPGPGLPEEHPQLLDVLKEAVDRGVPVLGVCLGMQAIHVVDGGALTNMNEPLHGRVTSMDWDHELPRWEGLWKDMPASMVVGHYHSWVVDEVHRQRRVQHSRPQRAGMADGSGPPFPAHCGRSVSS